MLVYDKDSREQQVNPLKELVAGTIPDQIEVGETNDYWLLVCRSSRKLEIVSKENGQVIAECAVNADALKYGITALQLKVAIQALALQETH